MASWSAAWAKGSELLKGPNGRVLMLRSTACLIILISELFKLNPLFCYLLLKHYNIPTNSSEGLSNFPTALILNAL